jgi:hypothetical protein
MLWNLGETLFGPADRADDLQGRSGLAVFLGVTLILALLLFLRRVDGLTNPQFWAEDGTVFFQQNLELGCWRALQSPFRGFPYLGQHLVACAATSIPFAQVPLFYNLVAYLVGAASLATFSLPAFRHVIRSDALRILLCVAIAALPQAAELPGSLTNVAWFLGIWLMLLTIMRLPASATSLAVLCIACLLATFSTPLSIVSAPLWFARAVYEVRRRRIAHACFATLALCGALAAAWVAGEGRVVAAPARLARVLFDSVAVLVLADAALGPGPIPRVVDRFGAAGAYVIALMALAALVVLARSARRSNLGILLYCAYGVMASSALVFLGRPQLAATMNVRVLILGFHGFRGRYHVLAVSLIYLAVLASIDRLPGRIRSIAIIICVTWLFLTEAPTFAVPRFHDLDWPFHAARLERKRAEHAPEPLSIPINPDPSGFWFSIHVDQRTMAPEVDIRRSAVLAVLSEGTVTQTFVARCEGLSEIDLLFGRVGDAVAQTIRVDLREETSDRLVTSLTLDGSEIIDGASEPQRVAKWERKAAIERRPITEAVARAMSTVDYFEALYFAPIPDSLDTRYVIEITAQGGTPHDSVTVYGSATDVYPDGAAYLNGTRLPGDVAFRYGCSRE